MLYKQRGIIIYCLLIADDNFDYRATFKWEQILI